MAPEGSNERIAARAVLLDSLARALRRGMSVVEWRDHIDRVFPQHVVAAGARDIQAIVAITLHQK